MYVKIFLAVLIATLVRIVWLLRVYPWEFNPHGHFGDMLSIDDECDPWTTWSDDDMKLVNLGKEYTHRTNLLMGCLVRDMEKELPFVVKKFSTLSGIFQRIHVIVMENNSKDNTRKIFLEWCRRSPWKNITFVCVCPQTFAINTKECLLTTFSDNRHGVSFQRIERMAYLRNRLHQYCCEWLKLNPTFEYVLYSDIDLHGIIYRMGVYHTFGCFLTNDEIQVIGFRGTTEKGWLWDPYAYEAYHNYGDLGQLVSCKIDSRNVSISQGLVRVRCSFSGGTFIRAGDITGATEFVPPTLSTYRYETIQVGPAVLCEHVPFYRNFEHIYINTNMIQTHTNFESRKHS